MVTGKSLRTKRVPAGISGQVLCAKLGIGRNRLSLIENGYVTLTRETLADIDEALNELIAAKSVIERTAQSVGWPAAV
jgi:transcriptional regulator with XRE-family HTH domain